MLSSIHCHLSILFGQRPSLIYPRTLQFYHQLHQSTPFLHVRIWQDEDYLSQSPGCSFCLNSESLFHIVTGCQQYLDCFTWRHNSILNFIANSLQPVINVHPTLYADVNGFLNPSIITGENLLSRSSFPNNIIQFKCLYVLELTVSFKSNLNSNAVHKKEKYLNLIKEMSRNYICVKFINLSVSSLGIFSYECCTFLDMMNDIGVDKMQQHYIIKTMINIAIRATYYIFCCRNKSWDSPDLIQLN